MSHIQIIALLELWLFCFGSTLALTQPIRWNPLPIPQEASYSELNALQRKIQHWGETDLDSAYRYLDLLRIKVKSIDFLSIDCEILRRLGDIRERQQQLDASIQLFKEASTCAEETQNTFFMCEMNNKLVEISLRHPDKSIAFEHLTLLMNTPSCTKLLSENDRDSLLHLIGSLYMSLEKTSSEDGSGMDISSENQGGLTLLLAVILLSVLILVIWSWWSFRSQKKTILLSNKLQETVQKLDASRDLQQSLELDLEHKRKQLTAMSLNLAQRNQMITEFKAQLGSLEASSSPEANALIHRMKRQVEQHLSIDQNWEEFNRQFREIHKGFLSHLKQEYPKLTAGDLRLCALLKLNLSTNEIAALQGIAANSVRITSYRIRKKMGLPKGTKLSEFLMSL
ncbi:MAG: hypothetical protein AAF587_33640 [Bacteroidota bacterium]